MALPSSSPVGDNTIRVMVVDDSAVVRGLLTRALEGEADMKIVASAGDGEMALTAMQRTPADVIILDIEMPKMDGLTALPRLLALNPAVKIIMASTLTTRNAEVSMKALSLGATDYLAKPSAAKELTSGQPFLAEMIAKVRALGESARRATLPAPAATALAAGPLGAVRATGLYVGKAVSLREMPKWRPDAIAIGSSTGGPQAVQVVLEQLGKDLPQPIFLTQHMPPTFTRILAENITRATGLKSAEATDGQLVEAGHLYIAPGDWHMTVERRNAMPTLCLNKNPPENFCRPAVDPMLRSLVPIYGKRLLTVILTGMGQDGMRGAESVVQAGGAVIAQDEASSVVWGMPGAVATAGLCSAILPLKEIGPLVKRLATTGVL